MEYCVRQDALSLLSENACAIRSYDIHADSSGGASGSVTILFRPFFGEAGEILSKQIRISLESAVDAYLVCELANGCALESNLLSYEQLCSIYGLSCVPEEAILTEGEPRSLIEPILPVPRVILFGGGHVAQCTARQLALLEYRIWVVEDREAFAKQELFPMAERVLLSEYLSLIHISEPTRPN
jgi:xanthine/CO dehydrogenase XdhC/CoxF family maturation factor